MSRPADERKDWIALANLFLSIAVGAAAWYSSLNFESFALFAALTLLVSSLWQTFVAWFVDVPHPQWADVFEIVVGFLQW